jgi:hypothetical protein
MSKNVVVIGTPDRPRRLLRELAGAVAAGALR